LSRCLMDVLVGFTVCLTMSFLLSEFFSRIKYPRVIGQILAGIILGLPLIKVYFIDGGGLSFISSLADVGVVFLMLLVGTEMKVHELKKASKKAAVLALLGYLIPLVIGFVTMKALGFTDLQALIIAICISISAEAVTVDILVEYNLLNTAIGTTIMEAGMIDDLLGVFSLAAVIAVVQGGGVGSLASMPGEFLTFIVLAYILGFFILPKAAKAVWKEKSEAAVFSLAVIFGLIVVVLSTMFGMSSVVGAFVAGIIIQLSIKNRQEEKEIVESLNIVTFGLVIPFFFIYTGMNLDLMKVWEGGYLIIVITFIALAGKIVASHIMGAIYHIRRSDRTLIGWGMNPRGAVELIIVNIALAKGLITLEIYAAVVAMALISAMVSPIMFRRTCASGGGQCQVRMEGAMKHNHHSHHSE
jgi:Kef-type K+ transport system membrane component KefB